jgi:hypothetical protein
MKPSERIEELRESIVLSVTASYCGTIPTWDDAIKKAIEEVDSLIAAAEEQGVAKYKAELDAELRLPDLGKLYYPEDPKEADNGNT